LKLVLVSHQRIVPPFANFSLWACTILKTTAYFHLATDHVHIIPRFLKVFITWILFYFKTTCIFIIILNMHEVFVFKLFFSVELVQI